VRDLKPGDEFLTYDGELTIVDKVVPGGEARVFNLEVEDFHTYFVDWNGIWVHNKNNTQILDAKPLNAVVKNPKHLVFVASRTIRSGRMEEELRVRSEPDIHSVHRGFAVEDGLG
jgi:hypothetical protein